MSLEIFVVVFGLLAVADWFMDMVQRTTVVICRANQVMFTSAGPFMLPPFIKLAFPITLAKWATAGYFAWAASPVIGLGALGLSWLANVVSPVPFSLTLPPIQGQLTRVERQDPALGLKLREMLSVWQAARGRI